MVSNVAKGALNEKALRAATEEGLTVRALAERFDRSPTTVRHWLKRYGLVTCGHTGRRRADAHHGHCIHHGSAVFVISGGRMVCGRCRVEAVSAWRRRAKRTLVAEAGGACVLCGYDSYVGALHFHHLDPAAKRFALGGRGLARAIETLRQEAAKCVLLCANCHSEVEGGHATIGGEAPDRG